jgi:hypothetical protein
MVGFARALVGLAVLVASCQPRAPELTCRATVTDGARSHDGEARGSGARATLVAEAQRRACQARCQGAEPACVARCTTDVTAAKLGSKVECR